MLEVDELSQFVAIVHLSLSIIISNFLNITDMTCYSITITCMIYNYLLEKNTLIFTLILA